MTKRYDYNYCSNYSEKDETQRKALKNCRREIYEREFIGKGLRKLIKFLVKRYFDLESFKLRSRKTNKVYRLEDFING